MSYDEPKILSSRLSHFCLKGADPEQKRTWNTDLIGYLDDLNIIHIEQQTSGHSDMNIRMLEYGSLISSRDGLIRYINQIYLSTDNTPVPNLLSIQPIKNLRRSIGSKFLFVDAGAWDAWAYFEHLDFDVALFGFLVTCH